MKPKLREFGVCLLAPLTTGLLLLLLFWRFGLYPLGDKTLAWCDMLQQVTPLWMQLKDVLAGEVSPFYSFRAAGGMNLWGVLFFFVSSPFSLLTALWDKADVLLLANVVTALKLLLCSLTAMWYFRERRPNLCLAGGVLLSVCYAFSGYAMMYYQNSVWLDVAALFPLLWLSAEGLLHRGGGAAYCGLLVLSLVVNYYIGYALLLFLALAAGLTGAVRFPRAGAGRYALRVGCHTALALALTAPVWLVSLLEVLASARTGSVVASVAGGPVLTRLDTTLPLLYCSAVPFALLIPGIRRLWADRRDRVELLLFALMLTPVVVDPINKIWHTGSYQAFPVRYGFITILLGLSLAAGALEGLGGRKSRRWPALGAGLAVGAALAVCGLLLARDFELLTVYVRKLWGDEASLRTLTLWALVMAGAAFAAALSARAGLLSRRALWALLGALVAGQSLFSGAIYVGGAARGSGYMRPIADLEGRVAQAEFYRVKTERKLFDVNLLGGLGFDNLAHYTSLTREDYLMTARRLGYSGYWMEVGSHGGSLITDALLNNRYTICSARSDPKYFAGQVYANETYRVLESAHQLPFGLVTGAPAAELASLPDLPRPALGAWALERLLGLTDSALITPYAPSGMSGLRVEEWDRRVALTPLEGEAAALTYDITADEPTVLYFDCFDHASNRLSEKVNGCVSVAVNGEERAAHYPTQRENGLLELGYLEPGERMEIEVTLKKELSARSFGVFGVGTDRLSEALTAARGADLTVSRREISGGATAARDGELLFLSVPYAEGWKATVNGAPAPVLRALEGFMAIGLTEGENIVSLRFTPVGLPEATLLLALGLLATAAALWRRRAGKRAPPWLERAAGWLLLVCASAVGALVYLAPVLLNLFW